MSKTIIQNHHIIYANKEHKQEDCMVMIYKGEHFVLTQLQRRRNISKGFIKALKHWIILNEDKSKELNDVRIK
jgi:hypothetical protein